LTVAGWKPDSSRSMSNHMTAEASVITLHSSLDPYKKLHRR
jgi:hypothetical protein